MICAWFDIDDDGKAETCDQPATHDRNCGLNTGPVCAAHTCRCSVTLEEAARRKEAQRIPTEWMAL